MDGFLVHSTLPSKALLERHFDEIYKKILVGKKALRVVKGYFRNKMGTLSRRFYNQILPQFSVRIAEGLYLVPFEKALDFQREKNTLLEDYGQYEKELNDFLVHGIIPEGVSKRAEFYPEYTDLIREYIASLSEKEKIELQTPDITSRVRIGLIPLRLDPTLFEEYVEKEARERRSEMMKRVEEEIEDFRNEQVQTAQAEIKKKLMEVNQAAIRALHQLREKGRVDKRTGWSLERKIDALKGTNLFKDPEVARLLDAYRGLAGAIETAEKPEAPKEVAEKPKKVVKALEKVAEAEETKKPGMKEEAKPKDYAPVFQRFAEAMQKRLKTKKEELVPELQEADSELVDALGRLAEAIA